MTGLNIAPIMTQKDKTAFDAVTVGLVGVFLNKDIDNATATKIAGGGSGPTAQGTVSVDADDVKLINLEGQKADGKSADTTLAIIYAYTFEGHLYRLSRPQIITTPGTPMPLDDAAAAAATGARKALYVWHVQPNQRIASVLVTDSLVEDMILRANMPGGGNGGYASNMQLGSYASNMQSGSYASNMQSGSSFASNMQSGASFASNMQSGRNGG